VNAFQEAAATGIDLDTLEFDQRLAALLERRGKFAARHPSRRRGWFVRRALLAADATGLVVAYLLAVAAVSGSSALWLQLVVLTLTLPLWIVAAKLNGLYDGDEERIDHSTIDEVVGVFFLVTLGAWVFFVGTWLADAASPHVASLILFWVLAIVLVTAARGIARTSVRRSSLYLQNTIIIGAGDIGQLAARKLLQHPEYGVNLVGFVDAHPRPRRRELEHVALVGPPDRLREIIAVLDIERVIIAFSEASHEELLSTVRELRKLDVQIDVVPRLFEIVGPNAGIHAFEGLSLVGLPPSQLSPSSRFVKRSLDYLVALTLIVLLAPTFLIIAAAIVLDSDGPVLFRQRRLGANMRPFTVLKFRTMRVDTDQEEHRRYIASTLTSDASPNANGLYKLDRSTSVTRVGQFLRKTSLDELPQLFNVLAGEMSLVGPRPCLEYETEGFAEHHYERFLMPPGLTGLWQVTARARSTFGEALDMDVEYVRGWSFGLDVRLLLKTPFSLVRMRATT
jgi:exopolysaccharide biosynthesis polyprenyl glycosylphosphotransferase